MSSEPSSSTWTISPEGTERPIPVTCFTGFLGAGKTTTILGLLQQLPKDYKVVLLKNEYGDVEVDSLLAQQSNITGVSEILNGCLCCTMVGLVGNAMEEIKDKYHPDRIIIESSGSAFPATLALQIRELEPKGFKLDGVVTVIDCLNFRGYEDSSPSAKLQARYTDLLLLSKHHLLSERDLDILMDHLGTLNEDTPKIRISKDHPVEPDVVFGLDTSLFEKTGEEGRTWEDIAGGSGWHGDEIETKSVWWGGKRPGHGHGHEDGKECGECHGHDEAIQGEVFIPLDREVLERELGKLNFEIYRVKGIVRLEASTDAEPYQTYILNWAFGRFDLTRFPSLDNDDSLTGVSIRLTIMGERGEVTRRAKQFAAALKAQVG
ncbi:CobW/HypB/UreG, nucleotide-binding domain-domain-containing protein [Naematelia encephala]|uniref:CobW/HypB/UreG, nucleotide-binding domain-domain-containing protein n=1 Tax=Naematelia encephala TaxID=71784 RepID=A0A1Y2AFH4_9TREE|nr:CobW/HypB/UreG, nucleotide-binding domain-domain-containing protein [Naematelia encephala]